MCDPRYRKHEQAERKVKFWRDEAAKYYTEYSGREFVGMGDICLGCGRPVSMAEDASVMSLPPELDAPLHEGTICHECLKPESNEHPLLN